MEGQNNGVVPPVGGEIASPNPTPAPTPADNVTEKPSFEAPKTEAPAGPAITSATPAESTPNPTAQFAQSTVGTATQSTFGTTAQNNFSAPQSSTTVEPMSQSVVAPAKKKGGAGKIIAIIVILLLLIGAGVGGFLFYRAHESNERVIGDALKNMLSTGARSAAMNATIDADGAKVELKLDTTTNSEAESLMKLDVKITGDEFSEITGKVEAIEGKDAMYIRVADYGTIASAIGELQGDEELEYQLSAIFNSVGDSWYEIPYSTLGSDYKKTIDCAREFSKSLYSGAYTDELADSFKANPFITVDGKPEKADGYKLYKIKVDEDKSKAFGDELEDSDLYKDFQKCFESASSYNTLKSGDAGAFKNLLGNGVNSADQTADDLVSGWDDEDSDSWGSSVNEIEEAADVYLGITPWKHELKHILINIHDTDAEGKIEIDFGDAGNVEIPSNAKSLEELKTTIESSVGGSTSKMESYYEMYCTEEDNYSGYASEAECKAAVDEYFGGSSDIESIIQGLNI